MPRLAPTHQLLKANHGAAKSSPCHPARPNYYRRRFTARTNTLNEALYDRPRATGASWGGWVEGRTGGCAPAVGNICLII